MENGICLIICIGIPGAGKTTFCFRVQEELHDIYKFLYFSYDELSDGDFTGLGRKRIFEMVENKMTSIEIHHKPMLILIDDNMYYKSMRSEYLKLAKKHNTSFLQLYFDVKLETALMRNKFRNSNKIPDRIICEMALKIEKPQKHVFIVDSTVESILNGFKNAISKALLMPLKKDDDVLEIIPVESKMHKIDIVLRKIVGDKIKQNKNEVLFYINKRKAILEKIKQNLVVVPENCKDCDLYEYFNQYF